ncbi:MAG: tol-pal system YbgF family protein [Planctomycetaceae bacterium]
MTTTPTQEPESELGQLMGPIQPYVDKYGSKVVLGLAALLLVAAAWIWWSRSSSAAAAQGWADFTTAKAAEDYADIADENPGTAAGAWARLSAANGYFTKGVQLSFTSRTASDGSFEKANSAYKKLLDNRSTPKQVRERALYGMARLEEATSGEDTSSAIAAYEKLLSDFPQSIYKELAEERVAELKKPEVQKFYAWFKEQDPSVTDDLMTPNDLPSSPGKAETGVLPLDSILGPKPGGVESPDAGSAPEAADPEKAGSLGIPPAPGAAESGDGAAESSSAGSGAEEEKSDEK